MSSLTFSIKRDDEAIVEITISDEILHKNLYIPTLLEKCFERLFQIIREQQKEVEEDLDIEEDDD